MTVQHRISISLFDEEYVVLQRLSAQTQKSKAELIRRIVTEYLRENPNRFRRETPLGVDRTENIVFTKTTKK